MTTWTTCIFWGAVHFALILGGFFNISGRGSYSPIHLFIRTGRFFGFHAERRFILYIKIYCIYNIKHLQIKNQLFFKFLPVRLNK